MDCATCVAAACCRGLLPRPGFVRSGAAQVTFAGWAGCQGNLQTYYALLQLASWKIQLAKKPTTQFGERKAAAPVLQSALMAVMAGLYIGSGASLTYYPLLQLASWIANQNFLIRSPPPSSSDT